jgi:hypothetical protein
MTAKLPKKLSAQNSTSLLKKGAPNKSRFSELKQTKQFVSLLLVLQAALIGLRGNLDVLSGKSPLDVVPWMITHGVELILKAQRAEKGIKESDRKSRSNT